MERITEEQARMSKHVKSPRRLHRRIMRRLLFYLGILGPGLIAANAGNDPGGIATYSSMGSQFGYQMLWVMPILMICVAMVQEMCARMGAVTGKGLSDLIRENFPLRLTVFVMFIFLLANGGVIVSEFIGIAAALNLFGIPSWIGAPCGGLLNGLLLPIILFAILYLVNKNQLMGRYTNGLIYNLVSYALAVVVSGLAVIYLVTQVLGFFGIQIFG